MFRPCGGALGNQRGLRGVEVNADTSALQRLKYRPLPQFAERQITISGFREIEKTVLDEMVSALPAPFALESDAAHMAMVLTKYGALDLTFVTSAPALAKADTITWDALAKLGLAVREGTLAEEFEWVERSMTDDACFLRVFLTWAPPWVAMELRNQRAQAETAKGVPGPDAHDAALDYLVEHVDERFPLAFTIDDACLTNSKSIWVEAHFYL